MPIVRVAALIGLSMIAFADNSILCRMALNDTGIDAASFTSISLVSRSGALGDHDFSALQSKRKGQLILKIIGTQTQLFGYQSDLVIAI